jgi:hypothetical protein
VNLLGDKKTDAGEPGALEKGEWFVSSGPCFAGGEEFATKEIVEDDAGRHR